MARAADRERVARTLQRRRQLPLGLAATRGGVGHVVGDPADHAGRFVLDDPPHHARWRVFGVGADARARSRNRWTVSELTHGETLSYLSETGGPAVNRVNRVTP
ncbi:hypothetical protein Acor_54020 [Acrocarpospora corrugata]|uniref:Uncharacterized protein n=1 Tax=Acrocarpospora corrugata TaxID=35763 RepID=A0A5M3W3L7_9ACTN|nr:hypothetical protein Acor_54020 [Acrocarpospora corrugata]